MASGAVAVGGACCLVEIEAVKHSWELGSVSVCRPQRRRGASAPGGWVGACILGIEVFRGSSMAVSLGRGIDS